MSSGPRIGVGLFGNRDKESSRSGETIVTTHFGWEYDIQFGRLDDNVFGVAQGILGVVGVERFVPIPIATAFVGLRTRNGFEVGVGPSIVVIFPAISFVIGRSRPMESAYTPVNLFFTISPKYFHADLIIGFVSRH